MKFIFKIGSIICQIGFYLIILLSIFVLLDGISRLWAPESALAKSFGGLDPIFSYLDIHFDQEPALYDNTSFITLYVVNMLLTVFTVLLFFRYMHKLLKNIHHDSLFMHANVAIFFKLGVVVGLLGTVAAYTENRMALWVLTDLDITNAHISYSNISYLDTLVSGIFLILIALALRTAVRAVEENKQTI